MRRIWYGVGLGTLLLSTGCGGEPIVCSAGTTPVGGVCVPDDSGTRFDADLPDDGGQRDAAEGGGPHDSGTDGGCVPSDGPDEPDSMLFDANCDGIDGDIDDAIFVASTGTADAAGTMDAPVSSIARGIELAMDGGRSMVLVANGDYAEAIVLASGVSIHGGYDATTWARSDVRAVVHAEGPVLSAIDVTTPTTVSSMGFEATDADEPGESSVAAMLVRASGVALERVTLVAGTGAAGTSPARPEPGPPAAMGNVGGAGVRSGACSGGGSTTEPVRGTGGARSLGCGCGTGGVGGRASEFYRSGSDFTTPTPGGNGYRVTDCGLIVAGTGAMGGAASSGGSDGRRGTDGSLGMSGVSGPGGGSVLTFGATGYARASGIAGVAGTPGEGGGGGGGGGGCSLDGDGLCRGSGGAGGGGGAGGCGGLGGGSGGGGGASIGLYLWESSPLLTRVEVRAGSGGNGGAGARGGQGGAGGTGGSGGARYSASVCSLGTSTVGGAGGVGGPGGEGGGGGGGTGGPSIGILLGAGSAQGAGSIGVSVSTGTGGARGLGGGTAPAGENGVVQPTLEIGG